jgi:hypothetical protein
VPGIGVEVVFVTLVICAHAIGAIKATSAIEKSQRTKADDRCPAIQFLQKNKLPFDDLNYWKSSTEQRSSGVAIRHAALLAVLKHALADSDFSD